MEVAILSRFYGKNLRGAEIYASSLSWNLQSLGHNVNIFSQVGAIIGRPQIIISTNGRWDVLAAKAKSIQAKSKLIVSGQSGIGWDDRINLYAFPDCFVALTDHQAQWARSVNPAVRVEKIPNGVDLKVFTPQGPVTKLNPPHPRVLCVGAVTKSKSGEISKRQHLLKAAAKKAGLSVLLVGKGGDMEVKHDHLPQIYRACDLFAYPTEANESFGIAMVEAMACGLPVVATDDPIRREIIGRAGIFVDPTDTEQFAKSLKTALEINWGNKPRLQAEKFSWKNIALQYDQLFRKLCSA